MKINDDKSTLFPLDPYVSRKPAFIKDFAVTLSSGPFTLLGVSYSTNHVDLFALNFPPKLSRLRQVFNLWLRSYSSWQKCPSKMYGLSQLYFFLVLKNPPENFFTKINQIILILYGDTGKKKTFVRLLIIPFMSRYECNSCGFFCCGFNVHLGTSIHR